MNKALEAHASHAGPGTFPGILYDLGSYPAAVPDREGGLVTGELYRLRQPEQILPLLDRYEGCTDMDGSETNYRREVKPVQLPDGESVQAWIYLYNRPTAGLKVIPGGDYLERRQ